MPNSNTVAVGLNTTHRASNGTDHANVVLNDTHRGSDGKNHSDVVLNNAHRVADGKSHSDVVLNNTHRAIVTGNPHDVTKTELGLADDMIRKTTFSAAQPTGGVDGDVWMIFE